MPMIKDMDPKRPIKQECCEESDEAETFRGSKRKGLENSEGSIKRAKPISTHIKQEICDESIEAESVHGSNPKILVKQEVPDAQEGLIQQQENVKKIRLVIGSRIAELEILRALSQCGDNPDAAVSFILENQANTIPLGTRISSTQKGKANEADLHSGLNPKRVKKEVPDCELISVQQVRLQNLEDGDFNIEPDWFLVGSTFVTGTSTSKGMKLLDNEIVHFSFPSSNYSYKTNWIVRFSTKRSGEVILYFLFAQVSFWIFFIEQNYILCFNFVI